MKKYIYSLMIVLIILASSLIYAALPTVTVGDNTYIRGNQNITVTLTGEFSNWNTTNLTIETSGCGYSTCSVNRSQTNGDTNMTSWDCRINTTKLLDDTSCTITATIMNQKEANTSSGTDTAYPDNTVPVCSLSSGITANNKYTESSTITYTCTNSSSATIYFGANSYDMTESSDSCTYLFDINIIPESSYNIYAVCSDGLNLTTSSRIDSVHIAKDTSNIPKLEMDYQQLQQMTKTQIQTQTSKPNWFMIAIVGLVIWYLIKKK